jgi:cyclic nucleotide gated channel
LGAFWYFLSIERETACWQRCFEKPNGFGCSQGAFRCTDQNTCPPPANPPDQNTCPPPANPPNDHDAYFGIFLQAVESGVASISFPQKLARCLWWGLQNLRYAHR